MNTRTILLLSLYLRYSAIVGPLAVTRNPTVHPGDIRLLQGVHIPELAHLMDVIVFPIQGDKEPIPFQISGGDLDGDEYCTFSAVDDLTSE